MKFSSITLSDKFVITAIIESPEEQYGFLFEGNHKPIKLKAPQVDLEFGYIPQNPHPDIIALVCFCAFYPYLTFSKSVTFPFPVSTKAKEAFERLNTFTMQNGMVVTQAPIKIENHSNAQPPYRGEPKNIIAFGGGMDSTSSSLLFPSYEVVNQLDNLEQRPAMLELFAHLKERNDGFIGHSYFTNIRSLNEPYGFSSWLCCYLLPILIAGDKRATGILTGTIFGAAYLSGTGERFNKGLIKSSNPFTSVIPKLHSNWTLLFRELGLYQYSAMGGLSEILTSKLVSTLGFQHTCLYCQKDNGKPCHRCEKCFRKNLELEYWQYLQDGTLRPASYWEAYNNKGVINFYKRDYRYFGHLMNFLSQSVPSKNLPAWFRQNSIFCNANTSWVTKFYNKALNRVPPEYLEETKKQLLLHFTPMDEGETLLCERYDCADYSFNDFSLTRKRHLKFLISNRIDQLQTLGKRIKNRIKRRR